MYSQRYEWEKQRAVASPLTREDQGRENCHYQLHIDKDISSGSGAVHMSRASPANRADLSHENFFFSNITFYLA